MNTWRARSLLGFSITALFSPSAAHAVEAIAAAAPITATVRPGERLGDWLLRNPPAPDSYPLGLSWQTPMERDRQSALQQKLLAALAGAPGMAAPEPVRRRMSAWLSSLPITGRVRVPMAEVSWLLTNPAKNPVLSAGDQIKLPARPSGVIVMAGDGTRCTVPHVAGGHALDYVTACQPGAADKVDRAWVVQPDGTTKGINIAAWNQEAQDEVAPGALIWAPARDSGWPRQFSAMLAEFLATQEVGTITGPESLALGRELPATTRDITVGAGPRTTPAAPPQDLIVTSNDWGLVGLLQTPSARMAPDGMLRFHMSHVYPYTRGTLMFQPLPWLEAGVRYTDIGNRLYGPADFSGDQSYKDKSLDFKMRLWEETATRPQVALGMIDIGGTGLFSSEYLVASKRSGSFDWSAGIAWGYLGHRGDVDNPLTIFGKGYNKRAAADVGVGGTVSTSTFFTGKTALFGGVQYQMPDEKLVLKLEYDGNNYKNEPQDNNRKQNSPINMGVVYRLSPAVDFTAGIERGNTLMVGFTLHSDLSHLTMPKILDEPQPPVRPEAPAGQPDWAHTAADLARQTQWNVREIALGDGELRVVFDEVYGTYWNERINRAVAVLHRDAPASVKRFVITMMDHGMPMTDRVVLRDTWVTQYQRYQAVAERFAAIAATEPRVPRQSMQSQWRGEDKTFTFGWAPTFKQHVGGPHGFLLAELGVGTSAELQVGERTWINSDLNLRLVDNYQDFKFDGPSALPRVRTDLRSYLTTSRVTMPNLQLTHADQLSGSQFYSIYGGYLESMFAGVGAEWLYRPWHSPVALGVDVNRVQKRAFDQGFGLLDYTANTGHATLYWDTGWHHTHINVSAGQYLAGDKGVTVEVSRRFDNGIKLGAWATRTNISAATFGEGSFDKGISLSIPLETMLPYSTTTTTSFAWRPLTRDGGARLNRANHLYDLTQARDPAVTRFRPAGSGALTGDEGGPDWLEEKSIWSDLGSSTTTFGEQVVQGHPDEALLKGSALVLASSLFDKSADKWAQKHQGGKWDTAASIANGIPIALGVGAGLLWWGASGSDIASETAWTSLKAAGLTLGAETLTKFAVGRARPEADLGTHHFSSFGKGAANSSFPSIHMGVSYSLVTPFAQRYDAPWLYAVAGATAFGRIQQRQHFVSDTVAGSLIGYGVGSLMLDQQRNAKGPRIGITDNGVWAQWPIN